MACLPIPPPRQAVRAQRRCGRSGGTRTPDRRFWRPLLYRLSYTPVCGQNPMVAAGHRSDNRSAQSHAGRHQRDGRHRSGPPAHATRRRMIAEPDTAAEAFDALARAVQDCRACPAMEGRRRVLSRANGDPAARVLFLAEAPGRLGGELAGVPLSADQSGRRFERLLTLAGLRREQIFITNAALCNPQDAHGHNRPPATAELAHCAGWLSQTLRVVDPAVVVTLGATALAALGRLEPHGLALRDAVG